MNIVARLLARFCLVMVSLNKFFEGKIFVGLLAVLGMGNDIQIFDQWYHSDPDAGLPMPGWHR
jgi:hypothetical protein